ncbi:MAG: hypothetical protein M1812_002419 [Candelaria pacifica]|nr:MAG: hypothetical protein M1812_002419 [Candelaria pacifica]
MADPLSIASGVFGLATAGIKLSSALYDICETIGSAQEAIEDIASDLSLFIIIVSELEKIFDTPQRVYSDTLLKSISDICEKCKLLFRRINRMIGRTENVPQLQFKSKVAWVFREKKVRTVKASLDSLKSTLGLMLQTLKLARDQRQNDVEQRQVLANLLRSQQRSVKVLQNLEELEIPRKPPLRTERSQENKVPETPQLNTAALLSEVVSPPMIPRSTGERQKHEASSEPSIPTDWRTHSSLTFEYTENTLGALYPVWKERLLGSVDHLVTQWTQPLTSQSDANERPQIISPPTIDSEQSPDSTSSQIPEELAAIDKQILKAQSQAAAYRTTKALCIERRNKVEDRLRKRANGWLEISDEALHRLEKEIEVLKEQESGCIGNIDIVETHSHQLASNRALAAIEAEKRSEQEGKASAAKDFHQQYKQPDLNFGKPSKARQPMQSSSAWLDTDPNSALSDSDVEDGDQSDYTPAQPVELPADLPEQLSPSTGDLRSSESREDGWRIPTDDHQSPTRMHSKEERSKSSGQHDPLFDQHGSSQPASDDTRLTRCVLSCQRQAWKPPQPFRSRFNTLSSVLREAQHSPLWFKASQDAYSFHLGTDQDAFYTIELAPSDLTSGQTSRVEWTVIGKSWALPKALNMRGWPYFEDSVGYVWIQKELNWVRTYFLSVIFDRIN